MITLRKALFVRLCFKRFKRTLLEAERIWSITREYMADPQSSQSDVWLTPLLLPIAFKSSRFWIHSTPTYRFS